ncbi:STAS domain-containing protein [Nonomuraea sp. NPDC048826]|uniref:STAS domain-containing protein n=1 Tax=Nonomuraea sp. NPDC048826 TaxID=3364347 RepID=UPI003715553D
MTRLSIAVDRHSGYSVVSLDGELDRSTRQALSLSLDGLLDREEFRLVVDTGQLLFCDSRGLWPLIAGQLEAEGAGGALRLIGVHGALARLLTVRHLVDRFPPYETLAQAARWRR